MHRSNNIIRPCESKWSWVDRELGRIGGGWRRYVRSLDKSKKRHNAPGYFVNLWHDAAFAFMTMNGAVGV